MDDAVARATNALREAIARMPDGLRPPPAQYFVQWSTTGRHYLREWITGLEGTLDAGASSLAAAKTAGLGAAGARELEPGLWRIDSASDKLIKLLALTLGTPVLRLNRARTGVEFRPDRRHVLNRLRNLSGTHPPVLGLLGALERLNEHPARRLRNEVSHSLSPVGELTPLSHLAVVYIRGGATELPQARILYTDSVTFDRDMTPQAIWAQLLTTANDALSAVLSALTLAAAVISALGHLEPPPTVYYDLDKGRASFDRL
jgi:hypothetical protein